MNDELEGTLGMYVSCKNSGRGRSALHKPMPRRRPVALVLRFLVDLDDYGS